MDIKDLTDEQKAEIKRVKDSLRITKVVATRAVKTSRGDFFVGMSAAWDTIQEDAGGMGTDLIDGMSEGEMQSAFVAQGMTLKQAKIATLILGMNVDLQAGMHAVGGGAISEAEYGTAANAIRRKYSGLIAAAAAGKNGNGNGNENGDA